MREIKFRVWAKGKDDDGCIGYLETRSPVASGIDFFFDGGWRGISYFLQHDNFIVQQYTGLKDKNGKEIYEGDICDAGMVIGPVEFIIGSFSLASNPLIEFLPKNICAFDPDFDPSWIDVTVIGNIYEKPEILKP